MKYLWIGVGNSEEGRAHFIKNGGNDRKPRRISMSKSDEKNSFNHIALFVFRTVAGFGRGSARCRGQTGALRR